MEIRRATIVIRTIIARRGGAIDCTGREHTDCRFVTGAGSGCGDDYDEGLIFARVATAIYSWKWYATPTVKTLG